MRTTIRLDDGLLADAKALAAERGTTLTAVIEDALRESLARRSQNQPRRRIQLPTSGAGSRIMPGVDLDDSAALLDLMESDDGSR
jgi:hypothetical protein